MLQLIQKVDHMVQVLLVRRAGREAAAREGPDVILMDITLPDGDGLHALRQIAARPVPPPVVMLTASIVRQ